MNAAAKVNSFLLQMSDRLPHVGPGWFELPTSLDEIADYLELPTGTIECHLTLLEERGAIASSGAKRICILDRGASRSRAGIQSFARRMSVDPVADIIGRRQPQDETSDVRTSILDVSVR